MIYSKRYLQFNRLVFDTYDTITDDGVDISFKGNSTAYTYGHGSYRPFKTDHVWAEEQSVSITLKMFMKKLPCELRPFYLDFAKSEIVRPGRLWAIQNNEIIWAYAEATGFHQQPSLREDYAEIDIDFVLPEGLWHKADTQKTFLRDYDVCTYLECFGFNEQRGCNCCSDCVDLQDAGCSCCTCNTITADMMLCKNLKAVQAFYQDCSPGYELVYDCDAADKYADDFAGVRICDDGNGIIAGQLYSDTDIPTDELGIIIVGEMKNPRITINGNTNVITGEYNGNLFVNACGDVYYQTDGCDEGTLLSPSVWSIPSGNKYGWTVYPRNNSVIIETNSCCGVSCAFFQVDALTI